MKKRKTLRNVERSFDFFESKIELKMDLFPGVSLTVSRMHDI